MSKSKIAISKLNGIRQKLIKWLDHQRQTSFKWIPASSFKVAEVGGLFEK